MALERDDLVRLVALELRNGGSAETIVDEVLVPALAAMQSPRSAIDVMWQSWQASRDRQIEIINRLRALLDSKDRQD